MLDRFSRPIRYAIIGFVAGGVLMIGGFLGETVVTGSTNPSVVAASFHWIGQFGTALLIVGTVIIGAKLALLFG